MPTRPSGLGGFVARTLVAIALVALALALWTLRDLLLLVFAGVLVAVILDAFASFAQRHARLPRGAALALAVVAVGAAIAGAALLFGAEVRDQLRGLLQSVPDAWGALRDRVTAFLPEGTGGDWLADAMPGGSTVLSAARGVLVSLGSGLTDLVVALVGGVYLAADPALHRRGLLKLLPASRRPLVDEALGDCGRALRLWLLGQGVAMAMVGLVTTAGLWWIGVPSPIALGLLAALLDFVPVVGPIVALVPALVLALAQAPETAAWTVALYLAVQQLEGNVIQPIVQKRAVELPPALLIFAIIGAGLLFGGLGVVLAAPLTVVAFVLVKRLYVREALGTPTPIPGEPAPGDRRPDAPAAGDPP